ncbi:ATP-binding protein [Noviherbaspirillum galbum]|uniref:histidine kinase n=1 Tax=Noviherbaspirillum galbum TaxID=2709383 RepID=A0A6B3SH36_9BURK|nr:ATP-binding protein [Noviherbaspirillum galbum]NEX59968.1 HAMP domain-containing histidine kinase [Noviherbaspirillum galbum]
MAQEEAKPIKGDGFSASWMAGVEQAAGHRNMLPLIELRWVAVVGQVTTINIVTLVFGITLPLLQMYGVLACLIAFNIFSHRRWRSRRAASNREMFLALLVDVASLTAQLYFSGGVTNPFAFLYLLQVVLSAVLLRAWSTWTITAITICCLGGLSVFSTPLELPLDAGQSFPALYIEGMLICFALNAVLLVMLVRRIIGNLRERDEQLAALRQRAAEEEHIVRMGLLASGAAHELGTPLATVSVILGDWRRLPELQGKQDLQEDIAEMEAQLQRCKAIVSGVLRAAGKTRGESSSKAMISRFLEDLAKEWRDTRSPRKFAFENRLYHDFAMVYDSTLKQMIINVLDNALEASPEWVRFEAAREADTLKLRVEDAGPGFPPDMLERFGTPYQSSKGRPGRGLGLFLVVNVARALGGKATARNRPEGGAVVEIALPLAAITLEQEARHAV